MLSRRTFASALRGLGSLGFFSLSPSGLRSQNNAGGFSTGLTPRSRFKDGLFAAGGGDLRPGGSVD